MWCMTIADVYLSQSGWVLDEMNLRAMKTYPLTGNPAGGRGVRTIATLTRIPIRRRWKSNRCHSATKSGYLIGGGRGPDEGDRLRPWTMTGSNPDSVRRVLNEPAGTRGEADGATEGRPTGEAGCERESTLDMTCSGIFHMVGGRPDAGAAKIAMEMPDVSPGLIDAELAIMLKVVCGHPPILRLDDGVYRITAASADLENTGLEGNRRVRKGETS